jgi:hypothetical protein
MTTQIPRADILTPIHKAIRRSLFETAMTLGRTDFSVAAEIEAAEHAVTVCLDHLREHAEHEDRHVIPELVRIAPELAQTFSQEHPELERASIAVESLWPRIAAQTGAERVSLGGELTRRFHALVAAAVLHMDREEREELPVLWDHFTDAELGQLSGRIAADIAPARMAEFGQLMFPALNGSEQRAMQQRIPRLAASAG